MKVLVIPEDQELDQFIVKPVVEALLADAGIKRSRVEVLPEPKLRGAGDALNKDTIASIVDDYPMHDLFLLLVDRDCNRDGNEDKAKQRESEHEGKLLACSALQEIEVWMLSGFKSNLTVPWKTVREECDPKERYAEPLLAKLNSSGPGKGRKAAMRQVTLAQLLTCSELVDLRDRLKAWAVR